MKVQREIDIVNLRQKRRLPNSSIHWVFQKKARFNGTAGQGQRIWTTLESLPAGSDLG
jgi:hypothetical protein